MTDEYDFWRRALRGEEQKIYETEPQCGYYAVQDRSPGVKPAKGNRWPKIPCAIWLSNGELVAERAGTRVEVGVIWPYCVKSPIPFETYQFWHDHERWPEEADAA